VNGVWIDEPGRAKEEICLFFKNRFQEEDWVRPKLDGVRFKAIGQQHNVRLSKPFNAKEIKVVVWECGSDKSPKPDDLNFKFIKKFWGVIKVMCFSSWINSLFMEHS